jgi:DNA-binding NarL/FixJ family response regulator
MCPLTCAPLTSVVLLHYSSSPDTGGLEGAGYLSMKAGGKRSVEVPIRVAVGDDDAAFRKAAVGLLEADPRIEVVGAAADGTELLHLALATEPDVVLLDVRMPEGGAVGAKALCDLSTAAGRRTSTLVVALTAETSPDMIEAMLRAGAVGYFAKGRIGAALGDLVSRVYDGEVILAAPTAGLALRRLLRENPAAGLPPT